MIVFNHYQRASIMVLLDFIVFAVGLVAGTPEPDFKVVSAGYFKQVNIIIFVSLLVVKAQSLVPDYEIGSFLDFSSTMSLRMRLLRN